MADEVATLKHELEALKLQLELERKKNAAVQGGDNDIPPQPERQRGKSAKPPQKAIVSKKPRVYVQHAVVGIRQGKWWLRDRQVLSRAMGEVDTTLKVRETWVWSGRTVILDKIVRLDEKEDEQVEQDKPELEKELKDSDMQQSSPIEVAAPSEDAPPTAQPSKAVETSEAASTAGKEVVDSKVEEVALPSAKADDEVRESSAPATSVMTNE